MPTKTLTHTPGPWTLEVGPRSCFHSGNRCAITKSGTDEGEDWNVTIAEVWPTSDDTDLADARLIAAAPDLLHFTRVLLDYLDRLPDSEQPDAVWSRPVRDLLHSLDRKD